MGRVERKQQCSVAQMTGQGSTGQKDQKRRARVIGSRVSDVPDSANSGENARFERAGVSRSRAELESVKLGSGVAQQGSGGPEMLTSGALAKVELMSGTWIM